MLKISPTRWENLPVQPSMTGTCCARQLCSETVLAWWTSSFQWFVMRMAAPAWLLQCSQGWLVALSPSIFLLQAVSSSQLPCSGAGLLSGWSRESGLRAAGWVSAQHVASLISSTQYSWRNNCSDSNPWVSIIPCFWDRYWVLPTSGLCFFPYKKQQLQIKPDHIHIRYKQWMLQLPELRLSRGCVHSHHVQCAVPCVALACPGCGVSAVLCIINGGTKNGSKLQPLTALPLTCARAELGPKCIYLFSATFKICIDAPHYGAFTVHASVISFLSIFGLCSVTGSQEWWKRIGQIDGDALVWTPLVLVLVMPSSSEMTEAIINWAVYFPLCVPIQ